MDRSETFTHHGQAFVIEAEDWPSEEAAHAAIIDLQLWAMQFEPEETAALHAALEREREALVHDTPYDREADPLPAVRMAQRHAVRAGLQGKPAGATVPTVTIEAGQVALAPAEATDSG